MSTLRLRASAVCRADGKLLVVRLRDPVTGVEALYPPGGGVEPGESPAVTAERETFEETGLRVTVESGSEHVLRHPFRWAGVDYDVTTHYFGASLPRAEALSAVDDAAYHLGASWLPLEDGLDAMAIHRDIASAVAHVVRTADRQAWTRHPNAGGPAAMLLGIHDQFRVACERLRFLAAEPARADGGWLARSFEPLARTLHHHHQAEEALLFPFVARAGAAPARLVGDHGELTRAIAAVEASLAGGADLGPARAALETFEHVLVTHLDREERLVVPLLLALSPAEAWAAVHDPT